MELDYKKNLYVGSTIANKAYLGSTPVWDKRLNQFFKNAELAGYTIDDKQFIKEFNNLHSILQTDFDEVLVPGVYKENSIAAISKDDSIIEYPFSRNSTKTYWDKDGKMQIADENVPTISYDPLTGECLGYSFNRALTNLQTNSTSMHTIDGSPMPLVYDRFLADHFCRAISTDSTLQRGYGIGSPINPSTTYTMTGFILMDDPDEEFIESQSGRIFMYNGPPPLNQREIKNLGGGLFKFKGVRTSGVAVTSSSSSGIRKEIENVGGYKVFGISFHEGDVSIDEPYIPTQGSIVTTVKDTLTLSNKWVGNSQLKSTTYYNGKLIRFSNLPNQQIISNNKLYTTTSNKIRILRVNSGFTIDSYNDINGVLNEWTSTEIKHLFSYDFNITTAVVSLNNGITNEQNLSSSFSYSGNDNNTPVVNGGDSIQGQYLKAIAYANTFYDSNASKEITA